jgi:hypothetical protein
VTGSRVNTTQMGLLGKAMYKDEFLDFYKKNSSNPDRIMKIFCFDHPEKLKEWLGPMELEEVAVHKYDEDLIMNEIHQEKPLSEAAIK